MRYIVMHHSEYQMLDYDTQSGGHVMFLEFDGR